MNLRNFISVLPVVAILVAACADQENPSGTNPGNDGEKPGDPDPKSPDDDSTDPSKGGTKGFCKVSTPGDAGKVIKATLLLPETVVEGGELFIDKTGMIACAAKSCSSTRGTRARRRSTAPTRSSRPD